MSDSRKSTTHASRAVFVLCVAVLVAGSTGCAVKDPLYPHTWMSFMPLRYAAAPQHAPPPYRAEPEFYGYYGTCWRRFPEEWIACRDECSHYPADLLINDGAFGWPDEDLGAPDPQEPTPGIDILSPTELPDGQPVPEPQSRLVPDSNGRPDSTAQQDRPPMQREPATHPVDPFRPTAPLGPGRPELATPRLTAIDGAQVWIGDRSAVPPVAGSIPPTAAGTRESALDQWQRAQSHATPSRQATQGMPRAQGREQRTESQAAPGSLSGAQRTVPSAASRPVSRGRPAQTPARVGPRGQRPETRFVPQDRSAQTQPRAEIRPRTAGPTAPSSLPMSARPPARTASGPKVVHEVANDRPAQTLARAETRSLDTQDAAKPNGPSNSGNRAAAPSLALPSERGARNPTAGELDASCCAADDARCGEAAATIDSAQDSVLDWLNRLDSAP